MRRIILVFASVALVSCTITQKVDPVTQPPAAEVCIIEDPAVREGFLEEYKAALNTLGYEVRLLPKGTSLDACPVTSTYLAKWSWDVTIYMSYVRLEVFVDGRPAGKAVYDATRGGGNMKKFIDAEPKIRELVAELFPSRYEPSPSS